MDKDRAVQTFMDNLDRMVRLPLITDTEMLQLYGEEVVAAVASLDRANAALRLCDDCQSRCCHAIRCELYAPQFQQCPIHDLRPPICRLHYCHRFFPEDDTPLKDLSDVFFDSLLTAQKVSHRHLPLFDTPPLGRCCPDLVNAAAPLVNAVREGGMSAAEGIARIREQAESYRAGQVSMVLKDSPTFAPCSRKGGEGTVVQIGSFR